MSETTRQLTDEDVAALADASGPALVVDVAGAAILWGNRAAAATLGIDLQRAPWPLGIDRATPALETLERLANAKIPLKLPARLLFWGGRGTVSLLANVNPVELPDGRTAMMLLAQECRTRMGHAEASPSGQTNKTGARRVEKQSNGHGVERTNSASQMPSDRLNQVRSDRSASRDDQTEPMVLFAGNPERSPRRPRAEPPKPDVSGPPVEDDQAAMAAIARQIREAAERKSSALPSHQPAGIPADSAQEDQETGAADADQNLQRPQEIVDDGANTDTGRHASSGVEHGVKRPIGPRLRVGLRLRRGAKLVRRDRSSGMPRDVVRMKNCNSTGRHHQTGNGAQGASKPSDAVPARAPKQGLETRRAGNPRPGAVWPQRRTRSAPSSGPFVAPAAAGSRWERTPQIRNPSPWRPLFGETSTLSERESVRPTTSGTKDTSGETSGRSGSPELAALMDFIAPLPVAAAIFPRQGPVIGNAAFSDLFAAMVTENAPITCEENNLEGRFARIRDVGVQLAFSAQLTDWFSALTETARQMDGRAAVRTVSLPASISIRCGARLVDTEHVMVLAEPGWKTQLHRAADERETVAVTAPPELPAATFARMARLSELLRDDLAKGPTSSALSRAQQLTDEIARLASELADAEGNAARLASHGASTEKNTATDQTDGTSKANTREPGAVRGVPLESAGAALPTLRQVTDAAIKMAAHRAAAHRVRLVRGAIATAGVPAASPVQIRQIVIACLDRAIDAAGLNGRVTISAGAGRRDAANGETATLRIVATPIAPPAAPSAAAEVPASATYRIAEDLAVHCGVRLIAEPTQDGHMELRVLVPLRG